MESARLTYCKTTKAGPWAETKRLKEVRRRLDCVSRIPGLRDERQRLVSSTVLPVLYGHETVHYPARTLSSLRYDVWTALRAGKPPSHVMLLKFSLNTMFAVTAWIRCSTLPTRLFVTGPFSGAIADGAQSSDHVGASRPCPTASRFNAQRVRGPDFSSGHRD